MKRALAAALLLVLTCDALGASAAAPAAKKRRRRKPTPAPTATATATATAVPCMPADGEEPVFDCEAVGEKQIGAARDACFQSNRRMLVVFGTNRCEACRTANRALTEPAFFRALARQFVPVFVDVTPGTHNETLFKGYGFDPQKGLPAAMIFASNHEMLEQTKNGQFAAVAGRGDQAVQEWILARFEKTER